MARTRSSTSAGRGRLLDARFLHYGRDRLLRQAEGLEKAGQTAALAQLGYGETPPFRRAPPSSAVAAAVALARLAGPSARHGWLGVRLSMFQLHQALGGKVDHLADRIASVLLPPKGLEGRSLSSWSIVGSSVAFIFETRPDRSISHDPPQKDRSLRATGKGLRERLAPSLLHHHRGEHTWLHQTRRNGGHRAASSPRAVTRSTEALSRPFCVRL